MTGASQDAHWMRKVVVSGAGSGVGVGAALTVLAGAAAWLHASRSGTTMRPAAKAVPRRRISRRVISCSRFMCVSFRLTGFGPRTSDRSARGLWRLDRFDYALEAKTCAFAGVLDRVRRDRVEDQEADLVVGDVDGPHKADTGALLGELFRRSSRALCAP